MKNLLLVTILSVALVGCWWQKEAPVEEVKPEVVEPEPVKEVIDPEVVLEEAFEEAVKKIPIEEVETFEEVVDEGDADEMLEPVTPQELESREDEATQASRVKVRRMASTEYQDQMGANDVGLDYRDFTTETFNELYGIRPMLIYVTASSCGACKEWDEELRNNADKLAGVNALVFKAEFDKVADFRSDYAVEKPGQAVYLSPMGEAMGTVENPEVDTLIKFFGRFQR